MRAGWYAHCIPQTTYPVIASLSHLIPHVMTRITDLKDVKTNVSIEIYIRMVARSVETDCGSDVWIVGRERDGDFERQSSIDLWKLRVENNFMNT